MRFPRAAPVLTAILLAVSACQRPPEVEPPAPPPPDWLWFSVWGDSKLVAFDEEQLAVGATGAEAALAIGLGADRRPYGFDFDPDGDLWVGTQGGELLEYAAADLRTSGTPEPVASVTTGAPHVAGVRFAADGSLWATVEGKVVGWSAATLAAGGAPEPDVVLTSASPYMATYANDLTFDEAGGLWVVGNDAVLRFSPEQLAVGGAVDPDVVLGSDGTSLDGPRGLAFDANGDLWVTCFGSGVVEKLRRQDLAASGTPTPVVRLAVPGTYQMRLAFDGDDGMWVSSLYGPSFGPAGHVALVTPPNRVSSGTAPASVELTELGQIDAGGAIRFHPGPG